MVARSPTGPRPQREQTACPDHSKAHAHSLPRIRGVTRSHPRGRRWSILLIIDPIIDPPERPIANRSCIPTPACPSPHLSTGCDRDCLSPRPANSCPPPVHFEAPARAGQAAVFQMRHSPACPTCQPTPQLARHPLHSPRINTPPSNLPQEEPGRTPHEDFSTETHPRTKPSLNPTAPTFARPTPIPDPPTPIPNPRPP